jgi:hypothetical protein
MTYEQIIQKQIEDLSDIILELANVREEYNSKKRIFCANIVDGFLQQIAILKNEMRSQYDLSKIDELKNK